MLEFGGRVLAQTGMHLGRLDDGARRRDQPVESLGQAQAGNRTGARIAPGDSLDRLQVGAQRRWVQLRCERCQAPLVESNLRPGTRAGGRAG